MFHSNISSNSVSTNGNGVGGLNTIELTEFRNKINSLLDELKALPNHEAGGSAVYTFTKIVQSTEVTDKHSSTLLLNHLTDTVKAFTVIPNTDLSTEGGATASPLDEGRSQAGCRPEAGTPCRYIILYLLFYRYLIYMVWRSPC